MAIPFQNTRRGAKFFDRDLPELTAAISDLAKALKSEKEPAPDPAEIANAKAEVFDEIADAFEAAGIVKDCARCNGTGLVVESKWRGSKCVACGGTGSRVAHTLNQTRKAIL